MNQEQQLNEISLKVGRVEVLQEMNAKNINDLTASVQRLVEKLENSSDIAREALDKSKSAHHRLDTLEENNRWKWRTVAGAFITSIVVGLVAIFWKGMNN